MKRVIERKRVQLHCPEYTRTKQAFKNECDINNIVSRWDATGVITHVRPNAGFYGDFTNASDYQDSLNRVMDAQESFMTLPSDLRLRFQNDPFALLSFLENPANREEAVKLGIISPQIDEKPAPTADNLSEPTPHS